MVRNFGSFDTLPLVEFIPDGNVPANKVMEYLRMDPPSETPIKIPLKQSIKKRAGNDAWNENEDGTE